MVTKQLKLKLDMYNSKRAPTRQVTWEGITQLDADQPSAIPHSTKYQAVRLFHKAARANEEEFRIMSEMRNTIQHYLCKLKVITAAILDIAQSNEVTTYQSGAHSLLLTRKRQCEQALASLETFTSHGDFPELSQYCSGDQYDTDGEESQLVPEEDPKSDSDVLDGCCKDQLETDNLDSDVGEPSIMSLSSETDSDDFFYSSDQEWEDYQLPTHSVKEPSKPPLLYKSSFESRVSTQLLNPRQSSSAHLKTDYRGPSSVSVDTAAKILHGEVPPNLNDTSSSTDEEELEVQHWRKEKFLREEYIHSTMVCCRPFSIQYYYVDVIMLLYQKPIELNDEQRQMLSKIKEGKGMCGTCV